MSRARTTANLEGPPDTFELLNARHPLRPLVDAGLLDAMDTTCPTGSAYGYRDDAGSSIDALVVCDSSKHSTPIAVWADLSADFGMTHHRATLREARRRATSRPAL